MSAIPRVLVVIALSLVVTSCSGRTSPLAPKSSVGEAPPSVANAATLVVFSEPGGFSTTDLRDAHDRVIQLSTAGDLIWPADGAHVPEWVVSRDSSYWKPPTYFIGRTNGRCDDFCVFSVRFGSEGGERHAYLTIDYGHSNPGTRVDVVAVNGQLVVTQTSLFPPGTPTLSGTVTEMTSTGPVPIEGVWVSVLVPAGWQSAVTDCNGLYTIGGLIEGTTTVDVSKDGYQSQVQEMTLRGEMRLDAQLVRR